MEDLQSIKYFDWILLEGRGTGTVLDWKLAVGVIKSTALINYMPCLHVHTHVAIKVLQYAQFFNRTNFCKNPGGTQAYI